jgi:hypothetical protein
MMPKKIPEFIFKEGFAHHWQYHKEDGSSYPLRMARNNFGCWCGYVGLPKGHPCFGLWYDDVHDKYPDLAVHGGLTYSEGLFSWDLVEKKGEERRAELNRMIEKRRKEEGTEYWEFGFDCNHFNDIAPLMPTYPGFEPPELETHGRFITYKDKNWVIKETERLARQFEEIEMGQNKKKKNK